MNPDGLLPLTNEDLATRARALAAAARPGSLERKAAGCVAVAAGTTRSLSAARRVLDDVRLVDVREAATALLDSLATAPENPQQ